MSITIKSTREIRAMRVVGKMAGETLSLVGKLLKPGMTTNEIDRIVAEDTARRNAECAPLNYGGGRGRMPFPKSVCTSINECVCHGIPSERKLKEGDIVNVDVTTRFEGFHGDTSATFYVGTPSKEAMLVTETARKCLQLGIETVRHGSHLHDIGAAIQEFADKQGLSVVRDYVGHGIGRIFHEEPQVFHYKKAGRGRRLKSGMIFTIEPMINVGSYHTELLDDSWTVNTADGRLSAQFEHTILVTDKGCEILTARDGVLDNSEIYPDFQFVGLEAALCPRANRKRPRLQ